MGISTLESGGKWYAYSGTVSGDASLPAFYDLITIPNTGLADSFVRVLPYYGPPVATAPASALGVEVLINDVTVFKTQPDTPQDYARPDAIELFVPRQSKFTVISLNTAANNDEERGVAVLGWYVE